MYNLVISGFITKNELKLEHMNDKFIKIHGGKITKIYDKIPDAEYILNKTQHGYALCINAHTKTSEMKKYLSKNHYYNSCYFKAKAIDHIFKNQILALSDSETQQSIYDLEKYLSSHNFSVYKEPIFISQLSTICPINNNNDVKEQIELKGGIIITNTTSFLKSLNNINLIISINNTNIVYSECCNNNIAAIDSKNIKKKYNRVIYDYSNIDISIAFNINIQTQIVSEFDNIWIIIKKLPTMNNCILDMIEFINGKKINYPIIDANTNEHITKLPLLINVVNDKQVPKIDIIRQKVILNELEEYVSHNFKNMNYIDIICDRTFVPNIDESYDCPICTEIINPKYICKTICGHIFCLKCIITLLNKNSKCPMCRNKIELSTMAVYEYTNSKIKTMSSLIDNFIDKTIIYINDLKNMVKISECLKKTGNNITVCNGTKKNKNIKIDEFNKQNKQRILIMNSKDFNMAQNVRNVKNIMTIDSDYKYIINKSAMGYDFVNYGSNIRLIIIE